MRIAAIDIGSNSLRCTIVDVPVGGRRTTLDEERAYVRLGRGLAETGRLDERAMDEAVSALGRMVRIASEHEVTHVRAVATAAVRSASNGPSFVARVRDEIGLEVEVISGEEEGRLAALSAIDSLAIEGDAAVIDIGGGSVEIVRTLGAEIESVTSLPLGAVVLSDRFRTGDPIPKADRKALIAHVRSTIVPALAGMPVPSIAIGSGGTVTTIAAIVAADRAPGLASVHGFAVQTEELRALSERLLRSTAGERSAIKGMAESRVDLITAGALVLYEAVRALGSPAITANARGMREGIIIEAARRELGEVPLGDRMRQVRDFGRQCRADVPHAEQVRRLALKLFDTLAPGLDLVREDRALLEAAALLHDVGYHISFEKHHKHSFHLISHAGLAGFTAREQLLVACIARYHSHAMPKAGHEEIQALSDGERDTVARLAAILRIADGLDRSGAQRVDSLDVDLDSQRLRLTIAGRGPFDVEVYGATHKADLFERVWGVPVQVAELAGDQRGS